MKEMCSREGKIPQFLLHAHKKKNLFDVSILMLLLLLLNHFSHVRLCETPEMAAHQAPQSLGFSRQEH